jgi:hypothetical protein
VYDERVVSPADAPDRANLATLQFFFTEELLQDVERSARASYNGRQEQAESGNLPGSRKAASQARGR